MSFPSRLKSAVRLRLQALEDRCCPSCVVSVIDGHIMQIRGDETTNRIEVRQTSDGITDVSCDGAATSFRGINAFDIGTGAGNDFVTANFVNPPDPDFNFRADLGTGSDVLNLDWQDPNHYDEAQPPRDMHFNIVAGVGDDAIDVGFMNPRDPTLSFSADLGAGDDSFTARLSFGADLAPSVAQTDPQNSMAFDVQAQQGDDRLSLLLGEPDAGPAPHLFNAELAVNFDGGNGDDTASIDITNVVVNAPMSLTTNVGSGDDSAALNAYNVAFNALLRQTTNLGGGDDNAMIIYGNVGLNADAVTNVTGGDGADRIGVHVERPNFQGSASLNVAMDGGKGNDSIDLEQVDPTGDLYGADRAHCNLMVAGGDGQDVIRVLVGNVNQAPDPELRLDWNTALSGDDGSDTIDVRAIRLMLTADPANGDPNTFSLDADGGGGRDGINIDVIGGMVAPDALLDIEVHGGPAADILRLGASGLLIEANGGTVWCQDGGDGNDVIEARLDLDPSSRGLVDVEVMGSAGDDDLTLSIAGTGDPRLLNALVDGGDGFDNALVNRFLLPFVVNCEQVIPIG